jgi:hypothetical protein
MPAERVRRVMHMMAAGTWYGYLSRCELAAEWGCTEGTIKSDAAEAHRLLTLDPAQLDEDRAALAAYCARMRRFAAKERNAMTGMRDIAGAMRAAELEAKFRGIDLERPAQAATARPRIEIKIISDEPNEAA